MVASLSSTCLQDFDRDGDDLVVVFTSGDAYRYTGAGEHYVSLRNIVRGREGSVGAYYNLNVRGQYLSTEVSA